MKNIYSITVMLMLLFSAALYGQGRIYAPDLRSPVNEATTQNPDVFLDWDAVTGQTLDITYEAQIATKDDFSDAFTFPKTDLSAQQTNELLFGQVYYWRVKAYDADEPSEWSETWSFTILETITVNKPNNSAEVYVNPTVEWDEVTGIVGYELQIDTSYIWNVQNTGTAEDVNATFVLDSANMWLAGAGGLVQFYNGATWTTIDPGVTDDLHAVFFINENTGFVVGEKGTILKYDSGNWELNDSATTSNLTGVSFANENLGWAVGDDGTILKYADGTWTEETNDDDEDLTGVFAVSDNNAWACGTKKTVLHMSDGAWTKEEVGSGSLDHYSIWFNDASNGWVSGKSGSILYYNGTEWTEQETGTTRHLYGISMVGQTGFAVGRSGTMVAFENGVWSEVASGVAEDLQGIWLKGDLGLSGGVEGNIIRKSGLGFDSPYAQIYKIANDTTEYQLQLLPFGKNVYYRMRTMHAKDTSVWSNARAMSTRPNPELDKPNDNSSDAHLLTLFRWKEYDGAVEYLYQIHDDESFDNGFETFVDSNSVNHQMAFFNKEYFWRVKAQHPLDDSEWSEVFSLTTIASVALDSPNDDETDVPSCPKYLWDEIEGAKSYQIMVAMDENFTDPMMEETEEATFQCQSPLTRNTVYYWKVRAISTVDTSAWSDTWSFRTEGYIGIDDEFFADAVEVYPNPNNGTFTLYVSSLSRDEYGLIITDLTGRVIMEERVLLNTGDNSNEVRLGDLENGLYMLKISKGNASVTKKIFIK
jgi:hypothetical protein